MLTDDELRPNLVELEQYEGRVHWPYLDTAKPANVTIGVGCLISSADALVALPLHNGVSGLPAADDDKHAEFFRVRSMLGGLPSVRYKGPLVLLDADIDALAFQRMRAMLVGLPAVFPGFDDYPVPIQRCLLDLAWNNGLGSEAHGLHPATGLRAWDHLRSACSRRDWPTGARECTVANPDNNRLREARNAWRAGCFLAVAA